MGMSRYAPSSVNASISRFLRSISAFDMPESTLIRQTFSCPVASVSMPSVRESIDATRPLTCNVPPTGSYAPASTRSSVDLPEPLWPISPTRPP